MQFIEIKRNYHDSIGKALDLIALAHSTDSSGSAIWKEEQKRIITESAFLKIFIAWEKLLEDSFVSYMMGMPSVTGKSIVRYVVPISDSHAHKMLMGNQRYVDWSNPDLIRVLSNNYFENGLPYEIVISSINTDIMDLKTIRNAAAHLSSTTSKQLDSLGNRKLGRPCNDIAVYDLILSSDPNIQGNTVLKTYLDMLEAAIVQITNG